MKHYSKLYKLGCFSLDDVSSITHNFDSARSTCSNYLKKGYIDRIKRNLYVVKDLLSRTPIVNKFIIATNINDEATVGYHSAFEYYGYANQVYKEVQVISKERFNSFKYEELAYRRFKPYIKNGVTTINKVRITNLERTVIDSIHLIEKFGGLEELLKCIDLIPSLNEELLLKYLKEYNNGFLYQKCGYILSYFSESLNLSSGFFNECKKHLPKYKAYLYSNVKHLKYHETWRIYAPEDLLSLISKGIYDLNAI